MRVGDAGVVREGREGWSDCVKVERWVEKGENGMKQETLVKKMGMKMEKSSLFEEK